MQIVTYDRHVRATGRKEVSQIGELLPSLFEALAQGSFARLLGDGGGRITSSDVDKVIRSNPDAVQRSTRR
jgi:hypothetical protein